jgi:group I intron endonuclease
MVKCTVWSTLNGPIIPSDTSGIYVIKQCTTGLEYVGQTVNLKSRLTMHKFAVSPNSRLHRAIKKHGRQDFIYSYCEVAVEKLNEVERHTIESRGTLSPSGFNLVEGGGGTNGWKHSQETKDKISAANTGKKHSDSTLTRLRSIKRVGVRLTAENLVKLRAGKIAAGPISEQTRLKLRVSHTGKPMLEQTRAGLLKANTGREMPAHVKASIVAALKGVPLSLAHKQKLREVNLGKTLSEATRQKMREAAKSPRNLARIKAVTAFMGGSTTPITFASAVEASHYFGVHPKTIAKWCRNAAPKYIDAKLYYTQVLVTGFTLRPVDTV